MINAGIASHILVHQASFSNAAVAENDNLEEEKPIINTMSTSCSSEMGDDTGEERAQIEKLEETQECSCAYLKENLLSRRHGFVL